METKDVLANLFKRINVIAHAENVVYKELGLFSREVLQYVLTSKDITPVNKLIGKDENGKPYLTRNNRVVAMHFFSAMLPFTTEGKASDASLRFVSIKGQRSQDKAITVINDFLHDPQATIWTWAKVNVTTEKKPIDYATKVGNAITDALDVNKGNLSKQEVLFSVLKSGISLDDMMAVAALFAEQEEVA